MSTDAEPTTGGSIDFVHFWPEGGGKRMIEQLFEDFGARHPNVSFTEGANSLDDHGMFVKSRILRENPPSVFVEWPGQNLAPYQRAGTLRDISDLWEANGWEDVFIEGPREWARLDGAYYGVPLDIHRMNNVFYHVDMAEEYGVDFDAIADSREFLAVLEQLDGEGVVGLEQPMKNPSDVLQLLANVIMGQFGAETYIALTQGDTYAHESELHEAVELLDAYAEYAREDAAFNGMIGSNDLFVDREAVSFCQGDWMAGAYDEVADFEYGEHWDRANFPGTDGVFMLSTDVLVASAQADYGDHTREFVEFVASPSVQKMMNRTKGSIPPRRDVDIDGFPKILREQFRDFKRADHFPAGHALQLPPEGFVEAKIAASEFVTTRDVDRTTAALLSAYE